MESLVPLWMKLLTNCLWVKKLIKVGANTQIWYWCSEDAAVMHPVSFYHEQRWSRKWPPSAGGSSAPCARCLLRVSGGAGSCIAGTGLYACLFLPHLFCVYTNTFTTSTTKWLIMFATCGHSYPVLHPYDCIQIFLFEIYICKWCDILAYISNI
jgi:hypothetical protein